MFKKSSQDKQVDLFSDTSSLLSGKAQKQLDDEKAWHNQFQRHIVRRIDEAPFEVLYSKKMGAPNASVSLLVGMMVLKEAFNWSDMQLFENCRFNLLVRNALGLVNMHDEIPGESTYYLFRKRVFEHHRQTGQDLIQDVFEEVTREQIKAFNVSGQSIRMDSKLIGSNIAYFSRYEIVQKSLCLFYKTLDKKAKKLFTLPVRQQLEEIFEEESGKTVYRSNREEVKERLLLLGGLICRMLTYLKKRKDQKEYQVLEKVFNENFQVVDKLQVSLRESQKISSDSIQSPHDPDAAYRNKGNPVKGYSVNVTETNTPDSLNLITGAIVVKANVQDLEFVRPAIESANKLTGQRVDKVYVDGAYQSASNDEFCQNIDMVYTGLQGYNARYDLKRTDEGLQVTDTHTGQIEMARKIDTKSTKVKEKWGIKTKKGHRYFDERHIRASELRRELEKRPIEELWKRNNVEATIFHLGYHLKNGKSKYRGLYKQQAWATCRCMWINLVRIMKFTQKTCQRTFQSLKSGAFRPLVTAINAVQIFITPKYQTMAA